MDPFPFALVRPAVLVALVCLSACAQPATEEVEGGIIEMTDADYIAWTGFPKQAVYLVGSRKLEDGRTESRVQFLTSAVTPAQIEAAPATQCAHDDGRSVVSSRIDPPGPEDDIPGTQIMTVICE
jgi:hypothetical protein